MHTRHRALTAIACLTLFPLAACTGGSEEEPTSTPTTQSTPPTEDPADATPQERVEAYFEESDAAAAQGWQDSSYADEYLVPELAMNQKDSDKKNADSGAVITGDRKLSNWTSVEEAETEAVIEFCDDVSDRVATKDGEPVDISNKSSGEAVAQFTLTRVSESEPWLIAKKGYHEEGTTCADHFNA